MKKIKHLLSFLALCGFSLLFYASGPGTTKHLAEAHNLDDPKQFLDHGGKVECVAIYAYGNGVVYGKSIKTTSNNSYYNGKGYSTYSTTVNVPEEPAIYLWRNFDNNQPNNIYNRKANKKYQKMILDNNLQLGVAYLKDSKDNYIFYKKVDLNLSDRAICALFIPNFK